MNRSAVPRQFGVFVGLCVAVSAAHAQAHQDVYYDMLKHDYYGQKPDGSLRHFGRFAKVSGSSQVQLHVVNVNTYGNLVKVANRQSNLFMEPPSGFSLGSLIGKVVPANLSKTLTSAGIALKGTITPEVLQQNVEAFNKQVAAFNEIANLNASLRSFAAHNEQPQWTPGMTDPREPGQMAMTHLRAKLKVYLGQLFQSAPEGTITTKATVVQGSEPPSMDDLQSLTEAKATQLKATFETIRQNYASLKLDVQESTPKIPLSKSTVPAPPTPEIQAASTGSIAAQQQLDSMYNQASASVGAIDQQTETRQKNLEDATAVYKDLTANNLYQYDGPTVQPQGDLITFTVAVVDKSIPAPTGVAATVLGQPTPAEEPMLVPPTKSTASTVKPKPVVAKVAGGAPANPLAGPFGSAAKAQTPTTQAGQKETSPDPNTYEVPVYVTGRLKLDFSSGLLVSNLTNGSYNTKPVGTTGTSYQITSGTTDQFSPSVGGLLEIYYTSDNDIVPALCLGIGQSAGNSFQYFLGASLMTGHHQRFVLSGGLAAAAVNRLNGAKIGDLITSTTVPTKSVFRVGYFVGLTFNLSN